MNYALLILVALSLAACIPNLEGPDAGEDGGSPVNDGGTAQDAGTVPCPAANGSVVKHTTDVTADETWAGDGTVHSIEFGITVRPGATLTLEACATVKVGAGLVVSVAGDAAQNRPARLLALGTPGRPVNISALDSTKPWGMIRALGTHSELVLTYTTVEGGGAGTVANTEILATGGNDPLVVDPTVKVDHTELKGSKGQALRLESGAGFTADSGLLTVTGNGFGATDSAPIELTPRALGGLPTLDVHGNALNLVRVSDGTLKIQRDLTIHNRGVPYHFKFDRVRVHSSSGAPTLTIEPGVELRFDDYLLIGKTGATPAQNEPGKLIAQGTPTQPIVFTTAKPTRAAGDWPGVWLEVAQGSQLSNVRIEAAGAWNGVVSNNCKPTGSNDHAALLVGSAGSAYIPSASDFSGVALVDSASHGINAMWVSGTFGPDLTAGFTFQGVAGCRQTKNGTTTGCANQPGCLVQ